MYIQCDMLLYSENYSHEWNLKDLSCQETSLTLDDLYTFRNFICFKKKAILGHLEFHTMLHDSIETAWNLSVSIDSPVVNTFY